MEKSILKTVKKVVNIHPDDSSFDTDILLAVNSAFSALSEIGFPSIFSVEGLLPIEDDKPEWSQLGLDPEPLGLVKTYIGLKTRMSFDPPGTSFLIKVVEDQIKEHEWRLQNIHDETADAVYNQNVEEVG